jgi:hypothetical protein
VPFYVLDHHTLILSRFDAGDAPDAISRALPCSLGTVYAVLRRHRPGRHRKARARPVGKREQILGLVARGHKVARVAELVRVSRAYCYRVLGEGLG